MTEILPIMQVLKALATLNFFVGCILLVIGFATGEEGYKGDELERILISRIKVMVFGIGLIIVGIFLQGV